MTGDNKRTFKTAGIWQCALATWGKTGYDIWLCAIHSFWWLLSFNVYFDPSSSYLNDVATLTPGKPLEKHSIQRSRSTDYLDQSQEEKLHDALHRAHPSTESVKSAILCPNTLTCREWKISGP